MNRSSVWWSWALTGLCAACGGSTNTGLSGSGGSGGLAGAAGNESGGTSGSAGSGSGGGSASGGVAGTSAGGTGSVGTPAYTLDNVCQLISPEGCALQKPCCQSSGFGFDAVGCTQAAVASCNKNVAEAMAGSMTFDPTKVDACLQALGQAFATCTIDVGDWYALLDSLRPCSFVFEGKLPTGATCDRDAQCAPSADPDVFVSCSETTKKCLSSKRLKLNEACALGDGVADFCGAGLYCDATLLGIPPYPGICKTATVEGQTCNAFKPYNLECGGGFYCNKATSVCTKAKVGGASCVETIECQTFNCALGKCTAQQPLVSQETCTG